MKKNILILFFILLLILNKESYGKNLDIYLNGEQIPLTVMKKNESFFAPLKDIFTFIGADVKWDSASQNIIISTDDKEIKIRVGFKQAKVNDRWVNLDMPVIRIKKEIFIPLRLLGETLEADVKWDKKNNRIDIGYYKKNLSRNFTLSHNASNPLSAGEIFTVKLMGPTLGHATMLIKDRADNNIFLTSMMTEKYSGLYEGKYRVRKGDILTGGDLSIKYTDRRGNTVTVKSDNPVYINTIGPVIKKVFPDENEVVYNDISLIYIMFDLKHGSIINGNSLSFYLCDRNVTGDIIITSTMIVYKLSDPLNIGENNIKIKGTDKSGNKFEKSWQFRVIGKKKL
ncbi:MAG: copper amine oxidase N-terminal domain-containing protein [Candidatus Eremiobacterota bacterium]